MNASWKSWVLGLAGAVLFAAPVQAATLIVQGGVLMGATGLGIGGNFYDVSFVTGSCVSAFGGCDDESDFSFPSYGDSDIAAQALLDQVFLDGSLGNFDSSPWLINGCDGADSCQALVPYGFQETVVKTTAAFNNIEEFQDVTTYAGPVPDVSIDGQGLTFAVFSPSGGSPAAVPEPSTWAMLLAGFGFIGAAMRRRRQPVLRHRLAL